MLQIITSIGVLYSMSGAVQLYRLIQNSRLRPRSEWFRPYKTA